ncbi:hypothetical protein B4113_0570 [Geobacillus sp. B4113_201601]|nr:hypothetical protein B4113_0570 [Geobacillus sp. B4113_201601]
MLNSGGSVIGSLIGGVLFDRIGGFRALLLGACVTMAASAGLSVWHGWPHYAVFLALIGIGSGIVFPVASAYAGALWPEGGRRAFNALYVAQNVGRCHRFGARRARRFVFVLVRVFSQFAALCGVFADRHHRIACRVRHVGSGSRVVVRPLAAEVGAGD